MVTILCCESKFGFEGLVFLHQWEMNLFVNLEVIFIIMNCMFHF